MRRTERRKSQTIALLFEQATCPGQLRCLGQNCSQNTDVFLNKPLVPGSFAAWGSFASRKSIFFEEEEEATCPGQLSCLGQIFFLRHLFFLNKPLAPGRFAAWGRSFFSKTDFQEFWDSCSQNKTSEISKTTLSGIMRLLCAEQDVGNL